MKELMLAFLLAQGGDLATTAVGLSRGCSEANPALKRAPIERIATVKSLAVAGQVTIAWGARRKGHDKAARAILWTGIAAGTFATVWNSRQLAKGC